MQELLNLSVNVGEPARNPETSKPPNKNCSKPSSFAQNEPGFYSEMNARAASSGRYGALWPDSLRSGKCLFGALP